MNLSARTLWRRLIAAALTVGLASAHGVAQAQPMPPQPPAEPSPPPPPPPPFGTRAPAPVMPSAVPAKVSVMVRVIDASNEGSGIDPSLSGWASALSKTPFSSFRLVQERTLLLADGGGGTLALPDGRTLTLQLTSHNSGEATVAVSSRRPDAEPVETTLTITRNRAFMYVLRTGQPGRALLLKVDVRY